ncbi:hypothetical protein [Pseudokordiimonas caeni]|uniref:hypothetical protein n=1 Tax=Pseudokordiimonas caeni TaxID=2997908 RepID=UPI0028116AE1|nr:hypothetical protein [Pseudokordiimonas caeni]
MNLIERTRNLLRRLRAEEGASILTETALSIPLYLTLASGTLEASNYLLLHLKMQHTVVAIADLTTRDEKIYESVVTDIFEAVPQIMTPYPVAAESKMIISAISEVEGETPSIFWQREGSGTLAVESTLGEEGDHITMPHDLVVNPNETVIITEYFYKYEPLIFDVFGETTLHRIAFFRPRIGSLQTVLP